MGENIQQVMKERGFNLDNASQKLTQIIMKGVKDAELYGVLSQSDFHIRDIMAAARPIINDDLAHCTVACTYGTTRPTPRGSSGSQAPPMFTLERRSTSRTAFLAIAPERQGTKSFQFETTLE